MSADSAPVAAANTPPPPSVPASRLLMTLAFGGAFAGLLIATVYEKTLPAIEKYADAKIEGAVNDVLGQPARIETLYLVGDKLSRTPPKGVELRQVTKAYVGFNERDVRMGVAVEAAEPGFADEVRLMIGFDPQTGTLSGFSILSQKETPGLGDKIEKDGSFRERFKGKSAPVKGTKNVTTDAGLVQTITGATISSRTVIQVINHAVALWQPRLLALEKEEAK
ncbi:MAG: RnfABCDGE type electron transport complex subunit G [Vicinamibacteria bacterium]